MKKDGVLLVNLGSPQSTEKRDVKAYLDEFLMDKNVIDIPYPLRVLLVKGIILRTRPQRSAKKYKSIWTADGSPLISISKKLHQKIESKTSMPVALAMRYGSPAISSGIEELVAKGVTRLSILPLYPQYAMATTGSIVEKVNDICKKRFSHLKIDVIPAFYNKKEYILALSNSIAQQLEGISYDHLLFSYHGIPERHIFKSDITHCHCKIDGSCCNTTSPAHEFCYRHQCYETTRLVIDQLQLNEKETSTSFQSRLGQQKWLQPYTVDQIDTLSKQGIKNLVVVTPAFVTDCLETLEEIGMEAKEQFVANGGSSFHALKCLNDDDKWVDSIISMISK